MFSTDELFAFWSAIILGLFSIAVGGLAKFRGPAKWYALFGSCFGFAVALSYLNTFDGAGASAADISLATTLIWVVFFLTLGWLAGTIFLVRYYARGYYVWVGPIFGVIFSGSFFVAEAVLFWSEIFDGTQISLVIATLAEFALRMMVIGWMAGAAVQLGLARRREFVSGQAILAAAMCAYPVAWGIYAVIGFPIETMQIQISMAAIGPIFSYVAIVAVWLKVQYESTTREGLAISFVAGFFLALGFFMALDLRRYTPAGFARAFDVLLVGYAILRLQYLDIDIKVRWGLSKSTVAAFFVAAFFIASEVAQQFFGDRFNNNYVGIAAAGALVLAIAPLQRLADRIATAAIPISATSPWADSDGRRILVDLARRLGRDGDLSSDDKLQLADVADSYGIGTKEAMTLIEGARK